MKNVQALKYLGILTIPLTVAIAFTSHGWLTYLPVLYIFAVVPLVELLFPPDASNISKAEEDLRKNDPWYDWMLYAVVPLQYGFVVFFLFSIQEERLATYEIAGRVLALGMMCGAFGINVAHELGHRKKKSEQTMAKALLLTSLYTHFFIEHNKGHHKNVATTDDPASSRYNEIVFAFWVRSAVMGYLSAWKIENRRLSKAGQAWFSLNNEMLVYQLLQLGLLAVIGVIFGLEAMLLFAAAATVGFLLLETVNYIEHYGLNRKQESANRYERVMPHHSWNSDHVVGRMLLFELSRHSDHHFIASRKYQILRHYEEAPQMPTGYPGMMVLSLLPPLWFLVMNRRVKQIQDGGSLQAVA